MFDEYGVAAGLTPSAARAVRRLHESGGAVRFWPGIYVDPARVDEPLTRIRAAQARYPDGVLLGIAAAICGYWPECPLTELEVACVRSGRPAARVSLLRRQVEPEWVLRRGPLAYTHPAFTAAYLAAVDNGRAVDEALRRGVSLEDILRAPLDRWPGGVTRRAVLADSRTRPWSQAERLLHRILRKHGITGWRANVPITTLSGRFYGDIVFSQARVIIEVDGREHHGTSTAFESDRARDNALVAEGWTVLRLTWAMLVHDEEGCVAWIRRVLRRAVRTCRASA